MSVLVPAHAAGPVARDVAAVPAVCVALAVASAVVDAREAKDLVVPVDDIQALYICIFVLKIIKRQTCG